MEEERRRKKENSTFPIDWKILCFEIPLISFSDEIDSNTEKEKRRIRVINLILKKEI